MGAAKFHEDWPIIDVLKAAERRGGSLRFRLIHTGQHYDRAMSGSFFEEPGIPDPDINLEVGWGTQAEQTTAITVNYEKVLLKEKSDLCLVVGGRDFDHGLSYRCPQAGGAGGVCGWRHMFGRLDHS